MGMCSLSHLVSFLIKILFVDKIKKHTKGSIKSYHKDSKVICKSQDPYWYIGKSGSSLAKAGQWLYAIAGMATICHSRQHSGKWVVRVMLLQWSIYKRGSCMCALFSLWTYNMVHGCDTPRFSTGQFLYMLVPFLQGHLMTKLSLQQRLGENNSLTITPFYQVYLGMHYL